MTMLFKYIDIILQKAQNKFVTDYILNLTFFS